MTGVGFHWGGELGFRECRGAPRGTKRERRGHGAGMDDKRVYDNEDHRSDGEQWDDEERDRE
ncbi:hypothetical protein [Mycobacteroides abscessus]|uniref:hypothetical protein n=1 Tax=Mycobacteroides abscessus TaxID=36809 RepID=UPI00104241B3|nr:hypothetical protein [Mycobacteroides abscessus]